MKTILLIALLALASCNYQEAITGTLESITPETQVNYPEHEEAQRLVNLKIHCDHEQHKCALARQYAPHDHYCDVELPNKCKELEK